MKVRLGLFGMLLAVTTPIIGQTWLPAFGVQGGLTRLKPAGTNAHDQFDLLAIPGTSLFNSYGAPVGTLFGVVPIGGRFAIEPSLSFSQSTVVGTTFTSSRLGARLDAAFGSHVYGAVGGTVFYLSSSGRFLTQHVTTLGITAAIGYRMLLSPRLEGRLEAQYTGQQGASATQGGSLVIRTPPLDMYSMLVGISSSLRDRPEPDGRLDGMWTPAIGIQGGYYSTHFPGLGTLSGLSLPGQGTTVGISTLLFDFFPQTPSVVAVIPVHGPWAVEAGFAFGRSQSQVGPGWLTLSALTLSARVNYAVSRGWYAAAGPVTDNYKLTGLPVETQTGFAVAWGYRFHISGDVGGRIEASYTTFAQNHTLYIAGIPAVNVLAIEFGMMMGV